MTVCSFRHQETARERCKSEETELAVVALTFDPSLGRQRRTDPCAFKASRVYIVRLHLKNKT